MVAATPVKVELILEKDWLRVRGVAAEMYCLLCFELLCDMKFGISWILQE